MQREKVKLIVDVPLTVQLETVTGIESSSQYTGVEYRYNAICESRPAFFYVPEAGRDAILQAQPNPGDWIEMLKQKRGGAYVFTAQLLSDASEPPPRADSSDIYSRPLRSEPAPPPPPPPPPARPNGIRMLAPAPAAPRPAPRAAYRPEPVAEPQPQRQAEVWPMEEIASRLFEASARIVKRAEEQCKTIGLPVEANFEDVRSLAIHFLISREKGGR